jgi:hypothetical protein
LPRSHFRRIDIDERLLRAASGDEVRCRDTEADFKASNFEAGAIKGIAAVSRELAKYFRAQGPGRDELPDKPAVIWRRSGLSNLNEI